eukprot:COSAG01_NODE_5743_length_4062_cov_464.007318_1_plen_45_part_00
MRVEIMGAQNRGTVAESQSLLIMNDPSISTRTRTYRGGMLNWTD